MGQFYGKVPKTAYNMRFKREAEAEPEAEPEAESEAEADAAIMSPYSAYRPYSMQNNRFYTPYQNTNSFYGRNSSAVSVVTTSNVFMVTLMATITDTDTTGTTNNKDLPATTDTKVETDLT